MAPGVLFCLDDCDQLVTLLLGDQITSVSLCLGVVMMPVVRIPDSVYERLQMHATPFVDTPATVIERLLNAYEAHLTRTPPETRPPAPSPVDASPVVTLDPDDPPDLQHTRVLSAEIGGERASNWNELVTVAHRCALARLGSFDAVEEASRSNIVKGRKEDDGYHYHRDVGLSIQYVGSNQAWRNSLHLAKRLGLPIHANFQWLDKPGASHPGEMGLLSWTASKS